MKRPSSSGPRGPSNPRRGTPTTGARAHAHPLGAFTWFMLALVALLPSGARAEWPASGVRVVDATYLQVIPDGTGGAYIAGQGSDADPDCPQGTIVGRVDADGNLVFGGGVGVGFLCNPSIYEWATDFIDLLPDEAGNAIISGTLDAYLDGQPGSERFTKVGPGGSRIWPVIDPDHGTLVFVVVPDGAGGVFLASTSLSFELHVQRIDANADQVWSRMEGGPYSFVRDVCQDEVGGMIMVWDDGGVTRVLRYDADGHPLWADGGVQVPYSGRYRLVPDGTGAAWVVRNVVDEVNHTAWTAVYYVDASGLIPPQWAGGVRVFESDAYYVPNTFYDDAGGLVLVKYAGGELRMTRVTSTGFPNGWDYDGRVLDTTAPGFTSSIPDGIGGFYFAWSAGGRIYANHVFADATMDLQWPAANPICCPEGAQSSARMVQGDAESAIAAWQDDRGGLWAKKFALPVDELSADAPAAPGFGVRIEPNPVTRGAWMARVALPMSGQVRLAVYDVAGRLRLELHPGRLDAGVHMVGVPWGSRLAPGVYLVRVEQGARVAFARLTVVD